MLIRTLNKEARLLKCIKPTFSNQISKAGLQVPEFYESIQFSKARLKDFGELPRGEIPRALQFSPETTHHKLSNKVQLVTENYGGDFATISFFIKAGSRFENIENSGAAHFLTYLLSRGSKHKTRKQFQESLDLLGARIETTTGRELIGFTLKVNSADAVKAVELLADALVQPDFNDNQIEADKEFVHRKILDVSRDQFEFAKEALFYTSFRDHMMGQSEYGIRDNIPTITPAHLQEFHQQHFLGSNTVIVVSGQFDTTQVLESAEKHINAMPADTAVSVPVSEKPFLTPSVMAQRDDEMYNLNVATAFVVPGFAHKDYFALKFFEKIVGDFNAEVHGSAHVNSAYLQYSRHHQLLGNWTGVNLCKVKYYPFSDTGLFTTILHGNDFWAMEMNSAMAYLLSSYSQDLEITEVYRGRAELFNQLLGKHASKELNEEIANEIFYFGRRISRTEYASRFSALACQNDLKKVIFDHFYDKELGVALWGPLHNICQQVYYTKKLNDATKANYLALL